MMCFASLHLNSPKVNLKTILCIEKTKKVYQHTKQKIGANKCQFHKRNNFMNICKE